MLNMELVILLRDENYFTHNNDPDTFCL